MTWSTISCLVLSSASLCLLTLAAPARLRKAAASGLSWIAAVVIASGLVLQLQSPATAHTASPLVVVLAIGADGESLEPPLEVIEAASAEAPAEAVGPPADAVEAAKAAIEAAKAAAAEAAEAAAPAAAEAEARPSQDSAAADPTADPTADPAADPADSGGSARVVLPPEFAAPSRQTVIIPQRPEWVDREPGMVGEDYCIPVSSALQVRERECRESLNERLEEAVEEYIQDYLGDNKASYFINYDIQDIRARLIDGQSEFSDVVEVSLGPMHQSHAMLKLTSEFRAELDAKWSQIRQTGRVVRTAGLAVGLLVVLSLMFGYFRLDSATKGYYTRRLQMVLVAAILFVVVGGIFYFRAAGELIYRLTIR